MYHCECGINDCNLALDDQAYDEAFRKIAELGGSNDPDDFDDPYFIRHPSCKCLKGELIAAGSGWTVWNDPD